MAYLTPNAKGGDLRRPLHIPVELLPAVNGALFELCYAFNWEAFGDMSPDECAAAAWDMYQDWQMATNYLIGAILPFARDAMPQDVLLCDGAIYSRVDYPELYAALASAYIVDADRFAVPDLAGVFLRGGAECGAIGGTEAVTLSIEQMPSHSHNEVLAIATVINGGVEAPASSAIPGAGSTGLAGGGLSHENLPPYHTIVYGIIAK